MGLRKKKTLIDQASDYVESVKPQIESAVSSARAKAAPLLAEARDKAVTATAEAREKAGPALADARAKAAPMIAEGAAVVADKAAIGASIAAEKAAIGRDIAAEKATIGRDLAAAKVAQLKGEPEPKKGGKLKKLLLFGGLAAAAGFAAKKLTADKGSDNWQSSYVPSPPPQAPVRDAADDSAGSSPDEAVADAAEAPHPVTTPDDPAETVTIDEDAAKKA